MSGRRWLAGVGAVAAVLVLWVLVEFVWTRGETPAIRGPDGEPVPGSVALLEPLRIGGEEQWVLIRGHDGNAPVLLFLHGGPGMPAMYLAHDFQRELERDFVVVHWDRRGAGKSFAAGGDTAGLTVRRTLDDTFELTERLRSRFRRNRVLLVGHSWGSYLGMLAVRERPELFTAFVGTGQLAAAPERNRAAQRHFVATAAEGAGDTAVLRRVRSTGEVTEADLFRYGGELRGATSMWPILWTGLWAPEYTLLDAARVGPGAARTARHMRYDVIQGPLDREVLRVDVPVFFFLGRHDHNTPAELAAGYLERLDAPLKDLIWFEDSAHFPFWTQPERFHEALVSVHERARAYWRVRASVGLY